jgi:hypothetical protein
MRAIAKMSAFLLAAAAGAALTLFVSDNVVGPSPGRYEPAKIYTFIADYAGVSADHSSYRNLAGFAPGLRSIRSADVLLYGSSKGMFGLRAGALNEHFGGQASFYNISVAYGAGLPFLAQIIAQNGIHDRIVVADLTDVASQFQMSPAAIEAMDMGTMESVTRAILINGRYQGDLLLSSAMPAITLDEDGFSGDGRLRQYDARDPDTGDDDSSVPYRARDADSDDDGSAPSEEKYPIALGHLDMQLGPFGGVRDRIIPFLRCRNISVIAIAIPFSAAPGAGNQFDPEFTKRSSKEVGFKYLPIPYEGLYTRDWIHLTYESSFELSRRLADALSSLGDELQDAVARNRKKQTDATPKCDMPGITTAVKLISTEPASYRISFHGHRFVIPGDAKIDWNHPVLGNTKGIVEAH